MRNFPPASSANGTSDWIAFHFYYFDPEKQGLLLGELVRPLVIEFLRSGLIGSFFIVRLGLGGPHIRLRLLPSSKKASDDIRDRIAEEAERFFEDHPSPQPFSDEEIRKSTEMILRSDPNESDSALYSNNTWTEKPFQPETDRYGGADLLPYSLDLFAWSSASSLGLFRDHVQLAETSRLMSLAFRELTSYVLGFSRDASDIERLVQYPTTRWETVDRLAQKGDSVFNKQKTQFLKLFKKEAKGAFESGAEWSNFGSTRQLRSQIGETQYRSRILRSHLHMLSNRLGLNQAYEIYVSRLLWRTVRALAEEEPGYWGALGDQLICDRATPNQPLEAALLGATLGR